MKPILPSRGGRGSHVKAGYFAFGDTNVDPSMRRAINDSDVRVDLNARKTANAAATQKLEDAIFDDRCCPTPDNEKPALSAMTGNPDRYVVVLSRTSFNDELNRRRIETPHCKRCQPSMEPPNSLIAPTRE